MPNNKKTKTIEKWPEEVYMGIFIPDGLGQWRGYWANLPQIGVVIKHSLDDAIKEISNILKKYLLENPDQSGNSLSKEHINRLKHEQFVIFIYFSVIKKRFKKIRKIDIMPKLELVQVRFSKEKWVFYANNKELVGSTIWT